MFHPTLKRMKPLNKMRESESKIQADSYAWFVNNHGLKHHNPRLTAFSVPNEVAMVIRGAMTQARIPSRTIDAITAVISQKMKNMGLRSGVSDMIVTLPSCRTLFIEFKTPEGRQSPNQVEFQQTVESTGHQYHVVRSLEQFKEIITREIAKI